MTSAKPFQLARATTRFLSRFSFTELTEENKHNTVSPTLLFSDHHAGKKISQLLLFSLVYQKSYRPPTIFHNFREANYINPSLPSSETNEPPQTLP